MSSWRFWKFLNTAEPSGVAIRRPQPTKLHVHNHHMHILPFDSSSITSYDQAESSRPYRASQWHSKGSAQCMRYLGARTQHCQITILFCDESRQESTVPDAMVRIVLFNTGPNLMKPFRIATSDIAREDDANKMTVIWRKRHALHLVIQNNTLRATHQIFDWDTVRIFPSEDLSIL